MKGKGPLLLHGVVRNYAWGRKSQDSIIASLVAVEDHTKPLAELWIGNHPTAPSSVEGDGGKSLAEIIHADAEGILGPTVVRNFGGLPFLFKILSVGQPLSIQAHPEKTHAAALHKRAPKSYPDSNHKLEIGIALSPAALLHGFRPADEIARALTSVPELRRLVGEGVSSGSVSDWYRSLMSADRNAVQAASRTLFTRLKQMDGHTPEEQWALLLEKLYPEGDVGIFSLWFLRFVSLAVGEAIYTAPNTPHAYLSGEFVECMTNSDNVVRGGLTEKERDVETLCGMLDYDVPSIGKITPVAAGAGRVVYRTPAEEFEVEKLESDSAKFRITTADRAELLFTVRGKLTVTYENTATDIPPGVGALIPASCADYTLAIENGLGFRVRTP